MTADARLHEESLAAVAAHAKGDYGEQRRDAQQREAAVQAPAVRSAVPQAQAYPELPQETPCFRIEAFTLDVPTTRIGAPPTLGGSEYPEPAKDAPNLILQTRDTRSASLLPYLSTWPTVHYHYAGTAGPVHMFTQGCSGGSA